MTKSFRWLAGVAMLIAACSFFVSVGRTAPEEKTPAPGMTKWQYKVIRVGGGRPDRTAKDIEDALKVPADEGWELANAVSDVTSWSAEDPVQTQIHLILKRPTR